ncbi:hypothetical protein MMC07_009456 [Pseudocyphellaria aurata]|nr:hypothetical protein [Pseudocyphellaria aurata]
MVNADMTCEEENLAKQQPEQAMVLESSIAVANGIDKSLNGEKRPLQETIATNRVDRSAQEIAKSSHDFPSWKPARQVIEEIEREVESLCVQLPSIDAPTLSESSSNNASLIMSMRFFNVAPTEINSSFGCNITGPAVLTARIYFPECFVYTPESIRAIPRVYILARGPFSVLIPNSATTFMYAPESISLGLERVVLFDAFEAEFSDGEQLNAGQPDIGQPDIGQPDIGQPD